MGSLAVIIMDEEKFKASVSKILKGCADKSDIKTIKSWLKSIEKEMTKLRSELDKNKNDFLKKKSQLTGRLNTLKKQEKQIINFLEKEKPQD